MNYRILRLSGVIGRGDKKASLKKNAMQFIIQELAAGRDVEIYNEASIRDFIDVRDVVRAIDLVINKGELNTIYNVGNGVPVKVKNTIEMTKNKFNLPGNIKYKDVPDFHKAVQVLDFWPDVTRLRNLGYERKFSLEDSLNNIING